MTTSGMPPTVVADDRQPERHAPRRARAPCPRCARVRPARRRRRARRSRRWWRRSGAGVRSTPSAAAMRLQVARSAPSPMSRTCASGTTRDDLGQRAHQQIEALDRDQTAGPRRHERVGLQSEARARRVARAGAASRRAAVGTPLGTTAYCSRRPMPRSRCSSTSRGGERHDRVRPARGQALERHEERRLPRPPVAVEDVAVRLVDHHGHAARAAPPGGR